ncbi:MAG: large conductance mechanosensitive channel protein MscL [Clostridia bacterium]|nr:large conductance mechanosensitive channel protein MscL [Clostridia bacterium]
MKKFAKEFKEFISKGNVLDLAVGVIIGGAFTSIINSLVNDIFMPLLGLITGGLDFSSLAIKLASDEKIQEAIEAGETPALLKYGSFIAAIINFLLIALVVFIIVKAFNKLRAKKAEEPEAPKRICPFCKQEVADDATRCPHCTSELPEEEKEEE